MDSVPIKTKVFSTYFHGIMDYVGGLITFTSPWLFGFVHNEICAAFFIPLLLGGFQLLMTIFTAYELGVFKVVPIEIHLTIDVFFGFFLMVSPWLYNFYSSVFLPHLLLGMWSLISGIFTVHSPFNTRRISLFHERQS